MENEEYKTMNNMENIWNWIHSGIEEAEKDFKQYQDGDLTKKQLESGCWMAKQYVTWGDYEGKCKGTGYLHQMKKLGFIKDLNEVE